MTKIYTCPVNDIGCPYYMDELCTFGKPENGSNVCCYYLGFEEESEDDEE